ncbi:MAG TPA: thioredoxin family protein [Longimicrobium sp.]|nr:thioredoxin family protein [Longimicrobium sp.]
MNLERWASAVSLEDFIERARTSQELWRGIHSRARVPDGLVRRAMALPPTRLLVLLEDWCGDAVNTIPPLARLVEAVPGLELRVLSRDDNPGLMDSHLRGTARAIPVVIPLDEAFRETGWWGSRPAELQAWVRSPAARAMPKDERYRHVRGWSARDRGRTALSEIVGCWSAAPPDPAPASGVDRGWG